MSESTGIASSQIQAAISHYHVVSCLYLMRQTSSTDAWAYSVEQLSYVIKRIVSISESQHEKKFKPRPLKAVLLIRATHKFQINFLWNETSQLQKIILRPVYFSFFSCKCYDFVLSELS